MAPSPLLLVILLLLVSSAARGQENTTMKEKVSNIHFYMHDRPGDSAIQVAPAGQQTMNMSHPDPIRASFGSVFVMDNPLTVSPDPNSTLVGRGQGIYAMSSQAVEFSLLMALTYNFVSGPFNGSSLSVVGRNPITRTTREMPVVGGTGVFRLARGYSVAQTHSSQGLDAIIRYNVTVLHY